MTEAEWNVCANPQRMLNSRPRSKRWTKRKLRLFACACCRRFWHLIPDQRSRSAVWVAERFADGLADEVGLKAARREAVEGHLTFGINQAPYYRHYITSACACVSSRNAGDAVKVWTVAVSVAQMHAMANAGRDVHDLSLDEYLQDPVMLEAVEQEFSAQANLLRDIFGNPFRPIAFNPAWRTATVKQLAEAIYEEKAVDRMPILGDALEEAGCSNADILNHCRQPGEHVKGCWVVDLILAKS